LKIKMELLKLNFEHPNITKRGLDKIHFGKKRS